MQTVRNLESERVSQQREPASRRVQGCFTPVHFRKPDPAHPTAPAGMEHETDQTPDMMGRDAGEVGSMVDHTTTASVASVEGLVSCAVPLCHLQPARGWLCSRGLQCIRRSPAAPPPQRIAALLPSAPLPSNAAHLATSRHTLPLPRCSPMLRSGWSQTPTDTWMWTMS